MLHAFNGGWYDAANRKFEDSPNSALVDYQLGSELWAYIPMNILPHLKYLTDPSYGANAGNHVFYVDLKPRIFDAQIFEDDSTHPDGWGTILVGGMRFGGGEIDITVDQGNPIPDNRTLRSSFSSRYHRPGAGAKAVAPVIIQTPTPKIRQTVRIMRG